MPLAEPTAPWEADSTSADEAESSNPTGEQQPSAESSKTDDDLDLKAFESATQRSKPTGEDQPAESEKQDAQDTDAESQSDEPAKVTLTDQSKKYLETLKASEDDALKLALKAYGRAALFSEKRLEKMFEEDPADFVEAGLKLAKVQRDQDDYGRTLREQMKRQPENPVDETTKAPAEQRPLPDMVKDSITKVLEPLTKDEVFADLAQPLGIAFTDLATNIATYYEAPLAAAAKELGEVKQEYQTRFDAMIGALVDLKIEMARQPLVKKYPQLEDPDVQKKVLDEYDIQAGSGKFNSVSEIYQKAVAAALGDENTNSLIDRLLKTQTDKKRGQPRAPVATSPHKPQTEDDKERLAYARAVKKGYGKDATLD